MAATVIDGKALAGKCKERVKERSPNDLDWRLSLWETIRPPVHMSTASGRIAPSAASTARNMPSRQRRARRS